MGLSFGEWPSAGRWAKQVLRCTQGKADFAQDDKLEEGMTNFRRVTNFAEDENFHKWLAFFLMGGSV